MIMIFESKNIISAYAYMFKQMPNMLLHLKAVFLDFLASALGYAFWDIDLIIPVFIFKVQFSDHLKFIELFKNTEIAFNCKPHINIIQR